MDSVISLLELCRAIRDAKNGAGTTQVARSLILYKNRGEWNGTMRSAIECLELACYEFEPKVMEASHDLHHQRLDQ
jgi:hypothetical protein